MTTVNSNVSVTLDGSKAFTVGEDTYEWFGRWMDSVSLWAPDDAPSRTIAVKLASKSWGADTLRFSGNASVNITDATSGTTDDNRVYISHIAVSASGASTITLNNAEVETLVGGGGTQKVTIGYWASFIGLNRGDDSVSVVGVGEVGSMDLGRGNDKLTTTDSARVGSVYMGRGDDTVSLGSGGGDFISLGRDADTIKVKSLASGGHVVIDGGEGVTETTDEDSDTVDFSAITKALTIDLNGQSAVQAGASNFHIRNFENVVGGTGKDTIIASTDANILKGGASADTFVFETASAANGDKILDFSQSADDSIDLSGIDASTKTSGNQTFSFIGTAGFHDKAGELRYFVKSGDTLVQGDVNGDGEADFTIRIDASLTLKSGDFLL